MKNKITPEYTLRLHDFSNLQIQEFYLDDKALAEKLADGFNFLMHNAGKQEQFLAEVSEESESSILERVKMMESEE